MMPLSKFTILPWGGTKTSVPGDDITLFKAIGDNSALTNDVGGQHFDLRKVKNAVSKSDGYTAITSAAAATSGMLQGLFELYDGIERDKIMFYGGIGYRIADVSGVWTAQRITPPTVSFDPTRYFYSLLQYGSFLLFTDGTNTPYKWTHSYVHTGDYASKLIQAGTEYSFKYLDYFQGRIIGAYTSEENGDLSIRWTSVLPSMGSLEFATTSQAYKPGNDPITGLKRMGGNALYLYAERGINRIDYYPDFTIPFAMVQTVEGQGTSNHESIIALPDRHFFFNRQYGFIEYMGGTDWRVISEDIEDQLDIRWEYAKRVYGAFDPYHKELVWCFPAGTESTPTKLLRYDLRSQQWRISPWAWTCCDAWTVLTDSKTWSGLSTDHTTWAATVAAGHVRWIDLYQEHARFVGGGNDGYVYYEGGTSANGSNYDSYRIEPVMDFGNPTSKKYLLEIWFGIGQAGAYSIDVYWRGGDTAAECEAASWTLIGSCSCNSPANAVVYTGKMEKFHQIKWGTDLKAEQYEVNRIDIFYAPQGKY